MISIKTIFKMNVQSIVLLMSIVALGSMGAASQAFADHHGGDAPIPIQIEVNGDTFDHESTIVVSGQVGNMRAGTPVALINIEEVDQPKTAP